MEITYIGETPADTTSPVITASVDGTLGNNGWYTSDVIVSWTVTDEESEITTIIGGDDTVIDADTSGVKLTCEATSAGGTAAVDVTIKRDATAPVVGITMPAEGAEYELDTEVVADWNAQDGLSGIADSSADTIDTSTVGVKTFTVIAADAAGNETTLIRSYSVIPPPWTLERLIEKVKSLELHRGTENSLIAKLRAAIKSLDKGNSGAAVQQVGAFINEVEALAGKKIDGADAADLIVAAEEIIAAIGN